MITPGPASWMVRPLPKNNPPLRSPLQWRSSSGAFGSNFASAPLALEPKAAQRQLQLPADLRPAVPSTCPEKLGRVLNERTERRDEAIDFFFGVVVDK